MAKPRQANALVAASRRVRSSLVEVLGPRVARLLGRRGRNRRLAAGDGEGLLDLAGALLSLRGKASGPSLASAFFDLYEAWLAETQSQHTPAVFRKFVATGYAPGPAKAQLEFTNLPPLRFPHSRLPAKAQ